MLYGKSCSRLTLALDIVRRIDTGPLSGYHELQVIKHRIDLCDTIGIEQAREMEIRCDFPGVPLDNTNLCWKAVELVCREYGINSRARIELIKNIPAGGGLAGGSSNAATVLMLCNRLWDLGLSRERLMEMGRRLGMDVPYYFFGGTAFDTETTATLRPIATGIELVFVLILPPFGVSTAEAYAGLDYTIVGRRMQKTRDMEQALISGNREAVISAVHNDFETSVFSRHSDLARIRDELLKAGCETAFMTGSGSTMAGICPDSASAQTVAGRLSSFRVITASTYR